MTKTKIITIIVLMFGAIFLTAFATTIFVGVNYMPLRVSVERYIPAYSPDKPSDVCKETYQRYLYEKYSPKMYPAWQPDSDCMHKVAYHSMIR